jgi:hypothetical protein
MFLIKISLYIILQEIITLINRNYFLIWTFKIYKIEKKSFENAIKIIEFLKYIGMNHIIILLSTEKNLVLLKTVIFSLLCIL